MEESQSQDTIYAMLRQEKTTYNLMSSCGCQTGAVANEASRGKMVDWWYKIVDHVRLNRETVAVSQSLLDRYLATPAASAARNDVRAYQLAAVTALYTAVKVHETRAMDPNLLCNLARGAYAPVEIEAAEADMLQALQWRVHPPTALSFVRLYFDLVQGHLPDRAELEVVWHVAKYQTELAVGEQSLASIEASVVALASLLNALDSVRGSCSVSERLARSLERATGINQRTGRFVEVRNCLYRAILRAEGGGDANAMTGKRHRDGRAAGSKHDGQTPMGQLLAMDLGRTSPRSTTMTP